jgi:uncharacterized protein
VAPADKDNFMTQSGKMVHLLDPKPSDVSIEDVAHALARICRFGGHSPQHLSVAQHSVLVSRLVPPEQARDALLHDASEAYIGDIVSPLKQNLLGYKPIEDRWTKAIGQQLLGRPINLTPEIHAADDLAFHAERASIFPWRAQLAGAPARVLLPPVSPQEFAMAKIAFLSRWAELSRSGIMEE